MKRFYLPALLLMLASYAAAQEDTTTTQLLSEVVVTGQYQPQSLKNSVYQVKVITRDDIQRQAPSRLQDVLQRQLNLRFSQDLSTGGSNVSMMGLSGQNVKILLDGAPLVGRQGTSNEININQIDVNAIERIEIIEGPLSVIYGADALAGVINIISKKPGKNKLSITASLQEETVGKEYGLKQGIHNQNINAGGRYKQWFFNAGVGHDLFGGWKDTAVGRELIWHKKDQIKGYASAGYENSKVRVYYRFDGLDEIITNPANAYGSEPALDQEYITDRAMHQLQGAYTFHSSLSANVLASYTHYLRQVYSTLYYPDGDVRISTAPGSHSLNTSDGFTVRGTALYKLSRTVAFQPGIDLNGEWGKGERIKGGEQKILDYALFLTSEITPGKKLNLKPGIRMARNSVYEAPPLIPSLNMKYRMNGHWDARLAYARGFRAPSLRELYFDFHDGSHDIIGNTLLEAEYSHSITSALNWYGGKKVKYSATLSLFYNDITNMIGYIQSASDARLTTYSNIDLYKTRGGTVSGSLESKRVSASAGIGVTGRYNEYKEAVNSLPAFRWSPEVNASLTYSFPKSFDVSLLYKYTGKVPFYQAQIINGTEEIRLSETEGYHWADVILKKQLLKQFTISAGVRNLFNVTSLMSTDTKTGGHTGAAENMVAYGRSGFLSITWHFHTNQIPK